MPDLSSAMVDFIVNVMQVAAYATTLSNQLKSYFGTVERIPRLVEELQRSCHNWWRL